MSLYLKDCLGIAYWAFSSYDVARDNCCYSMITLSNILLIILLMAILRYILESVTLALASLDIGTIFDCKCVEDSTL